MTGFLAQWFQVGTLRFLVSTCCSTSSPSYFTPHSTKLSIYKEWSWQVDSNHREVQALPVYKTGAIDHYAIPANKGHSASFNIDVLKLCPSRSDVLDHVAISW